MNGVGGPQGSRRPTVENKISIILYDENTVWVHAASVTGPFRMFVFAGVARVINNQVAVGLHNHVQISVETVSVWGPNRLASVMVNNKVAVPLHDRIEDTVSADKLISNIKFWALEKTVALSTPESDVFSMIVLITWTITTAATAVFFLFLLLLLKLLLMWVWAPELSSGLTKQCQVSVIHQDEGRVTVLAVCVWSPDWVLVDPKSGGAVYDKVAISLTNNVDMTWSFTMGVGGPDWVVFLRVYYEISVALHHCVEFSVLTSKPLICVQNLSRVKLVASSCMIDRYLSRLLHNFRLFY